MRKTKFALMQSMIALLLCFSMLIGTTFAWFTDEVISGSNIIQAGNLDAEMYWTDDLSTGTWYNAEKAGENTPFDYDLWEPGYTEVRYVKIVNAGKLALKYNLTLAPAGEVGKLAEVIDVYYAENVTANIADRTLSGMTKLGALLKAMNGAETAKGELLPGGETIVAVALHMDELAGNEYQGKSIGDGFVFKLLATQLAKEPDSFGPDYDENAAFPVLKPGSITADISSKVQGSVLTEAVTMVSEDGAIAATVPAGTKVSGNSLILSVSELSATGSNITLQENEILRPMDVHIEGVAAENTAPILVTVKEAMMKGLNIGNYQLYHVEQSGVNTMTAGALDQHNGFTYDPATGDVTVALATFSEVTMVAEPAKWEGNFDYSWYTNAVAPVDGESVTEYTIANADQLAAFGAIVGGMKKVTGRVDNKYTYSDEIIQDSFKDKTVKLIADINLGDDEVSNPSIIFYPIGYWNNEGTYERKPLEERTTAVESGFYAFEGTFDGNGNTISNFYQNTWEMKGDHNWYDSIKEQYYRDGMGLFGKVYGGTVKNLTVKNFSSDGEITTTGVIAAYADSANGKPATFENITIFNCNPRVYNIGNGGIVGCAGWYSRNESLGNEGYTNAVTFKNITVDQTNKISALWGTYDVSCGGILGQYYPDSGCGIKLENCHVSAIIDVNNDVCANYQYYWYRYSGMFIGTIRANTKDDSGYTVADSTGIIATGCTYSYGSWNEYWYCELVKNSSASYTHDYQFGRLTNIDDLSEIKSGETWLKEGNFALVSDDRKSVECYHIFKNSDGQLYRHFHDVADESNPNIYEDFDLNGDGELNDLKEDRQRYYLPFGQVFNGLGYGVKPTYTFEGFELVEDGTVISGSKFNVMDGADLTYRSGEKIYLKDLVALGVDISKLSQSSLYVAASPVGDDSVANITYSRDVENWENNYFVISNDTTGAIKLVITDYFYCTPTVIYLSPEQAAEKFTAYTVGTQNAYTQITLGTLFGVKSGATIGNVTATVTDPNGNETTVTGTGADWATQTIDLTKDGTWTVAIKDDDAYCAVTTVTFTVNKANKFIKKFDKDFLYRVGNVNKFDVGYIFGEDTANYPVRISSVNVSFEKVVGDVTGSFTENETWTSGTIQFTGTGVVKVTISADGANDMILYLEVVDAKNITSATGSNSADVVLLNDVKISSNGTANYTNCTVYGNGFTFDIRGGMNMYNSKQGHGIIITKNATIDNLVVIGDVYDSYGAYTNQEDYTAAFDATNTTFTNCYIANCATPVRANGVTITNTTLYGGTIANLIISGGTNNLTDVTTVNYNDEDRNVLGLGILISEGAADNTRLILNGTLKQYNYVCDADVADVPGDEAQQVFNSIFNTQFSNYHIGSNPTYVNTGIIFMTQTLNTDIITDNAETGYSAEDNATIKITISGLPPKDVNGAVYAPPANGNTVDNDYDAANDTHKSTVQGDYLPTPSFDLGDQTLVKADDSDTRYMIGDINGVEAMYQDGDDPLTLNLSKLMTVSKYTGTFYAVEAICKDPTGNVLSVTDDVVTLDRSGVYTLVFTVYDNIFYNCNGNKVDRSVERTYEVAVNLSVKEKSAADPTITVSGNDLTGEWEPVISGIDVSYKYKMYPLQAITSIMDDANKDGKLEKFEFKTNIASVTLSSVDNNAYSGNSTVVVTYTTGQVLTIVLGIPEGLSSPSTANGGKTLSAYQDSSEGIYIQSDGKTTRKDGTWPIISWSFKGTSQKTVTDSTQVKIAFSSGSGSSTCLTADTLITLADGTQKRVDELTYDDELLVWDFYNGRYTAAPISIIYAHEEQVRPVLRLNFSDGTTVKVISSHGFFDTAINNFVYIGEDNAAEFVGHSFVRQNGDICEEVFLESYEVVDELTTAYWVQTAVHNNAIAEGMLSITTPDYEGWFDYFNITDDMKYDEEHMHSEIEKYGLFTYEELAEYGTYEQFVALNGQYMKILIGRGVVTMEDIIALLEMYA